MVKKNDKDFDCVEMKRKISLELHRILSKMTDEERIAFWEEKAKEMIERRKQAIAQLKSQSKV